MRSTGGRCKSNQISKFFIDLWDSMKLLLGVFVLILEPPSAADSITLSIPMNDTAVNLTNVNMNATSVNPAAISVCNNTHQ